MKRTYIRPTTQEATVSLKGLYLRNTSRDNELDVRAEEDEEAYIITRNEDAGAKERKLDLWQ